MGGSMTEVRAALLVSVLVAPSITAQQRAPTFEVASVKPNPSNDDNSMRNLGAGGRMVFVNYSLHELIAAAYDIQPFQLIGGTPWLRNDRFDITAKASTNATLPELNLMLRSLLADRFKLKVHHEQRELPAYFLVKAHDDGRLGPAMKPSVVDCGPNGRGRGPAPGQTRSCPPCFPLSRNSLGCASSEGQDQSRCSSSTQRSDRRRIDAG
jgi:uncharacterized protein (TIGR03435 family)